MNPELRLTLRLRQLINRLKREERITRQAGHWTDEIMLLEHVVSDVRIEHVGFRKGRPLEILREGKLDAMLAKPPAGYTVHKCLIVKDKALP